MAEMKIVNGVLKKCPNVAGEVIIPEGVVEIDYSAFEECSDVTSVVFPNSLTTCGLCGMFSYAKALKKITIPNSMTTIFGIAASSQITEVVVAADHPTLKVENGVIYSKDGKTLVSVSPALVSDKYIVPDGVEVIGVEAFGGCKTLTEIVLPSSVVEICHGAFMGCKQLQQINLPNGLKEISESTFQSCSSLESIVIPDNVKKLKAYAFAYCGNLQSITLGAKLDNVARSVFDNCKKLTDITFPEKVKTIACGYNLFTSVHFKAPAPGKYNIFYTPSTLTFYIPKGSGDAYASTLRGKNVVEE